MPVPWQTMASTGSSATSWSLRRKACGTVVARDVGDERDQGNLAARGPSGGDKIASLALARRAKRHVRNARLDGVQAVVDHLEVVPFLTARKDDDGTGGIALFADRVGARLEEVLRLDLLAVRADETTVPRALLHG